MVRYITKADRKTAHVYSKVIEAAKTENITTKDFLNFIDSSGGLDKISSAAFQKSSVMEYPTVDDKLRAAAEFWQCRTEVPYSEFKMTLGSIPDCGYTEYEYFACIKRNGVHYVVAQIPADKAFEKRAISLFGEHMGRCWSLVEKHLPGLKEEAKEKFRNRIKLEVPTLHSAITKREQKEREEKAISNEISEENQ